MRLGKTKQTGDTADSINLDSSCIFAVFYLDLNEALFFFKQFLLYPWASQVALVVKNLPASAGDRRDAGLIPGLGRSPGGGRGNPLQCSCLENPTDRGAWELQSRGSQRVGDEWCDRACTHTVNPHSWTDLKDSSDWSFRIHEFLKQHLPSTH